ncbi:MAG TPA: GNAT family N-acetyltransferase [Terriglobales bacterium]|nr:GNAT family N-acetyltransferase [Terriglobales bacterium]
MPAIIREYRPDDFETLWQIDQACFARGISYTRRELAFYIARKRGFTLVAELDGRILGFVVVDRDRQSQGHVITIDVLPEAQRSGLGSRLMTAAEERLRALGCSVVFLETAVDNAAALAFYKRHGYTLVHTIPRYYLDSIDALVLAKDLAPDGAVET